MCALEGAGDIGLTPAAHPGLVPSWAVTDQPTSLQPCLLHHLYHRAEHPHPPNASKAESRGAGSQHLPPPNSLLYTASSPKPNPRCHTKFSRFPDEVDGCPIFSLMDPRPRGEEKGQGLYNFKEMGEVIRWEKPDL